MADVACVDLFCGAGGLTHGLISEGIKVVAGIDVDEACRHPFEANNAARFINEDVGQLDPKRLDDLFGGAQVKVLAGCAPANRFRLMPSDTMSSEVPAGASSTSSADW